MVLHKKPKIDAHGAGNGSGAKRHPGRIKRLAGRLLLASGIATAIVAPKLALAQSLPTTIKDPLPIAANYIAPENKPLTYDASDKYVKPDGVPDTLPGRAMDARAKKNPKVGPGPNPNAPIIIGEKFCDVSFEGENVIFENVSIADKDIKVSVGLHDETNGNFQKGVTIVFVKQTNSILIHNGKLLAHYRFIKDPNKYGGLDLEQVVIAEVKGLPFSKSPIVSKDGSLVIFAQDDGAIIYLTEKSGKESVYGLEGKLFTHPGAVYEDVEKGIFVASTPTALFVKTGEKIIIINYNIQFGEGPAFTNPTLDKYKDKIRIRDPTMPDQYMRLDPLKMTIGLFDNPSVPDNLGMPR